MRIAKPMLLILTPLGVAFGLYEAWRVAGGLVFIMAALLGVMATAFGTIILTIRRERAAELAAAREQEPSSEGAAPAQSNQPNPSNQSPPATSGGGPS